jgi:hypothetical protein
MREMLECETDKGIEPIAHAAIVRLEPKGKNGVKIYLTGGYSLEPKNFTMEEILNELAVPDPDIDLLTSPLMPGVQPELAAASNELYAAGGELTPDSATQVPVVCPDCQGAKMKKDRPPFPDYPCGTCSGDGKVPLWAADQFRALWGQVAPAETGTADD